MADFLGPLSIAMSLVGSIWLVGVVALLAGAPGELVVAAFVVGLVTAVVEWRGTIRKSEAERDDESSRSGRVRH